MRRVENQNLRRASCQRSLQFLVGQSLIQRHADAQTAQNSEIAFQPLFPVFSYDSDAFSLHAAQHHACAEQTDSFIKICEGNMLVADILSGFFLNDERVLLPKGLGAVAQQRAQVFVAYRRKNFF